MSHINVWSNELRLQMYSVRSCIAEPSIAVCPDSTIHLLCFGVIGQAQVSYVDVEVAAEASSASDGRWYVEDEQT